jgi:hypothetical protein
VFFFRSWINGVREVDFPGSMGSERLISRYRLRINGVREVDLPI